MSESPTDKAFWLGRVDARPLALFRALLALAVAYDLGDRLRDFHAFYTDDGIATRALAGVHALPLSLAPWLGSATAAGVVFALGFVGALALFVGFQTRVANALALIAIVSLQERCHLANDGGDQVLRLLLVWSLFIDLGAYASVDARRGRGAATIPALPVRVLQLQVIIIHLFAGLAKHGLGWRDGTAVFRVLHGDELVRSLGRVLVQSPSLCTALTYGTIAFELAFGFLVWSPWRSRSLRTVGVIVAHTFHLGILLALKIGGFSGIMQIALVAFWLPRRAISDETGGTSRAAWGALALLTVSCVGSFVSTSTQRVVIALGLDEHWEMFAPDMPPRLGALRFVGIASDGELDVDAQLRDVGALRYSRWAKLEFNLIRTANPQRGHVAAYLCRRWALTHQPLIEIRAQRIWRVVDVGDGSTNAPTIETVYVQPCQLGALPSPPHEPDAD